MRWNSDDNWENWVLSYGKYRGKRLGTIAHRDPEYLLWLADQTWLKPGEKERVEAAALHAMCKQADPAWRPPKRKRKQRPSKE